MAVGQWLQFAVVMELGPATSIRTSVERNHDRYVSAFIMMPMTLVRLFNIVVSNLNAGWVRTTTLPDSHDNRIEDSANYEPHVLIKLGTLLS